MPVVTVNILAGKTLEQKRSLAKALTKAVVDAIDVLPEHVTVTIREDSPENVAVGGVQLCDR